MTPHDPESDRFAPLEAALAAAQWLGGALGAGVFLVAALVAATFWCLGEEMKHRGDD